MRRLSSHCRTLIMKLAARGFGVSRIRNEIKQVLGIKATRLTIRKWMKRYKESGSSNDLPRYHLPPKLGPAHLQFIERCMQENSELTAMELQARLIDEMGISVSKATITKARRNWVYTGTAYCQMIREPNKIKRLAYCQQCVETGEQFDNVIFTDETKIQMQSSLSRSCRKKGMARKLVCKPKHPYTVYAWAGISKRGPTPMTIFVGIMDSSFYQKILETNLVPYVRQTFPDGHRLYQDNDPKHTSKATKQWMEENGINWWPTPPESPDLNPIELIWAHLKWHLKKNVKPKTKDELVQGIQDYWAGVTPDFCQRYISHLKKVIPVVISKEGAASGY